MWDKIKRSLALTLHDHLLYYQFNTHTQCRPLSGRILSTVATVDTMSLHQLVSGRVCPEVVGCLHLCVLQSTRSNCHIKGEQLHSADTCCRI